MKHTSREVFYTSKFVVGWEKELVFKKAEEIRRRMLSLMYSHFLQSRTDVQQNGRT